jgi:uncharacterized protein (DUF1330 family)
MARSSLDFGGHLLARGGKVTVLDEDIPPRGAITAFDSVEAARRFRLGETPCVLRLRLFAALRGSAQHEEVFLMPSTFSPHPERSAAGAQSNGRYVLMQLTGGVFMTITRRTLIERTPEQGG